MRNKFNRTLFGSKDLSWFTRNSNGFMRDMTLFQESSKSCLKSLRTSTRKMNGFNWRRSMTFSYKRSNKSKSNLSTQSTKTNNLPNNMKCRTETQRSLMKFKESGSIVTMNFSSNTSPCLKIMLTSRAKETPTWVDPNKSKEEWALKNRLKCRISSMNFKTSTMFFVTSIKKLESSTKGSTKKTLNTIKKTTIC